MAIFCKPTPHQSLAVKKELFSSGNFHWPGKIATTGIWNSFLAAGFGLLGLIDPVKAQTNVTLAGSTLFPTEATSYSNNVLMRFSVGAPVDFLLVGGGGGGGNNSSGGGGAVA